VPKSGTIFVTSMGDLWGYWVPDEWIKKVLDAIRDSGSKATFLFLTKNPERYLLFQDLFTENMILGVTLETNYPRIYTDAPLPHNRYNAMRMLRHPRKFVSVEPILVFELPTLLTMIYNLSPEFVFVGYDNYYNRLPEPPLWKTRQFIRELERLGLMVYRKTLRPAWYESPKKYK